MLFSTLPADVPKAPLALLWWGAFMSELAAAGAAGGAFFGYSRGRPPVVRAVGALASMGLVFVIGALGTVAFYTQLRGSSGNYPAYALVARGMAAGALVWTFPRIRALTPLPAALRGP